LLLLLLLMLRKPVGKALVSRECTERHERSRQSDRLCRHGRVCRSQQSSQPGGAQQRRRGVARRHSRQSGKRAEGRLI
jgi:hypothetical protein